MLFIFDGYSPKEFKKNPCIILSLLGLKLHQAAQMTEGLLKNRSTPTHHSSGTIESFCQQGEHLPTDTKTLANPQASLVLTEMYLLGT